MLRIVLKNMIKKQDLTIFKIIQVYKYGWTSQFTYRSNPPKKIKKRKEVKCIFEKMQKEDKKIKN